MTPPEPRTDSPPLIGYEQILEAAWTAIEEHGPDALSGQIALSAELARSAYRALRAEARLDLPGTPLDVIRALTAAHVSWAQSHPNLYRFLVGRCYQPRSQQWTAECNDLAAEIIAAAARYFPRLADDSDAFEATLAGMIGLFDASVLWWLSRPAGTCEQFIDRLTAQAWLTLDRHLGEIGVPVDPAEPLPRAPAGR
jgi:AcrR family transcriptional regulator